MGVYSHGRLATSQASLVACQLRTKLVRNDIKRQTHQLKLPDDTSHKLRTEMPNEVRIHSKTGPKTTSSDSCYLAAGSDVIGNLTSCCKWFGRYFSGFVRI